MAPETVEITTKLGQIKGLVKTSEGTLKKQYFSFQGIPYAKPPVENLRFKAPVPYGYWNGVLDATREGNDCIQQHMLFKHKTGAEDCLYLNVYTPQLPGTLSDKKPVMVWIHGGGFNRGSGSAELYGPDFLIEEDIVLVTINYRCGVLGFLSLENEKVPGNFGLKDQSLALRWVQDNIHSFGGDATNVTIFGESAGGASVHYHMLSPLSKGLFHKAILQSGASLCQWAFQDKPKEKAFLIAKELGCASEDPDTVLEFLMSVPAKDFVELQENETLSTEKETLHRFSLMFLPCVESSGNAPFLSDSPRALMEMGEFANVPTIIGALDKEGLLAIYLQEIKCEKVNSNISILVPVDLDTRDDTEDKKKLGKEILQFYTNTDSLSWDRDVMLGYVDFISDVGFILGIENSRELFLKQNSASVFTYLFSYTTPRAYSAFLMMMGYPEKASQFIGCGAGHGDDLVHLFKSNMPQAPFIPPSPDDQAFMDKFVKMWANFAKKGDPNYEELGVNWKPDNIKEPHYLSLGKEYKAVDDTLFPRRMDFWKKIYEKQSFASSEDSDSFQLNKQP